MGDEVFSRDEGVIPGRQDREAADGLADEHQMTQHRVIPAGTCTRGIYTDVYTLSIHVHVHHYNYVKRAKVCV